MNPEEVRADQQGSNVTDTCIKNDMPPGRTCLCQQCQADAAHQRNLELQEAILLLEEWATAEPNENYPERRRYSIDSRDGVRIFWRDRFVECSYHASSYVGRADSIRSCLSAYHAFMIPRQEETRLRRCFEYIGRVARGYYPSSIACKNDALDVLRATEAPAEYTQLRGDGVPQP